MHADGMATVWHGLRDRWRGTPARVQWMVGAGVLLAAVAAFAIAGPIARANAVQVGLARELAELRERTVKPAEPLPRPAASVSTWWRHLADERGLPDVLQTLFSAAQLQHVAIASTEHHQVAQRNEELPYYEIRLDARAAYPAARRFINQVLLTVPGVALTQLSLTREAGGSAEPRWRMTFVIFMRPAQ
ncbi:hypothetical protein M8A51_18725 [Schlegelella sp. S2-27]|uniref:Uncharacterized protein n=1 Tax=Caldimonas mangrovi TaxID=2944811 RepID=A0ABT0YS49_9BURK|nr:hypothetical protein [Caldimonas mangrovi]MCM5681564.1 hypothetical protein [Caldimonas mangrovi]